MKQACAKRPINSRTRAERIARRIRRDSHGDGDDLAVYWCRGCRAFHLGHLPADMRKSRHVTDTRRAERKA